jgi:riboflavin-specific deaminase-like protein
MSVDGRIAAAQGQRTPLSGSRSLEFVHRARAHVDAIAVGAETVRIDDPLLTSRPAAGMPAGLGQPLRVVFGSRHGPAPSARVLSTSHEVPTLLFVSALDPSRRRALERLGVEIVNAPGPQGRVDLAAALERLHERGVRRLLVEGGARLNGALLARGLADEVHAFVTPWILGGVDAPPAVAGTPFDDLAHAPRLEQTTWRRLGEDLLLQGYVSGAVT